MYTTDQGIINTEEAFYTPELKDLEKYDVVKDFAMLLNMSEAEFREDLDNILTIQSREGWTEQDMWCFIFEKTRKYEIFGANYVCNDDEGDLIYVTYRKLV